MTRDPGHHAGSRWMTADREARYRVSEGALWSSLGVAPSERRVRLPRLGREVRVQELGTGPPVLFVHGGSTCGTSWADLAVRLPGSGRRPHMIEVVAGTGFEPVT